MKLAQRSLGLVPGVILAGLTQLTLACGESKQSAGGVPSAAGGRAGRGGSLSGVGGLAGAPGVAAAGGTPQDGVGGSANASSGGAGGRKPAAGAGGMSAGGLAGGESGSAGAGAAAGTEDGSAGDGAAGAGPVTGFAADFIPRARAALKAGAPTWTCATTLPTVGIADSEAVRDAVRAFIAQAVDVAPADITMSTQTCSTPSSAACSQVFAHDTEKSGGGIYDTVNPLAQELEANTTNVEVSIWVPMKDGITLPAVVVMTGISDGWLVGMAVFNTPDVCN